MAAAPEKGEGSGSAGRKGSEPALEDLLLSLNIKEEDIGGVFVAKADVESLKEGSKWMAVMRLLSSKPFSAASLEKMMNCLGDWQRITEQGPWIFRDHGLLVEKYDGTCKASLVELNRTQAWVQIHDVPELYRKKHIITDLVANVGEVITVDMHGGDFVRARVWLDVRNELRRFVAITPEGEKPVVMRVKYEKVPRYCAVCGHMGHVKEECGSGVHSPSAEAFGSWMLADTAWNRTQLYGNSDQASSQKSHTREGGAHEGRAPGRGGRSGAGRGGRDGRGRGGRGGELANLENRKRKSSEARLNDGSPAKDSAVAPLMLEWKDSGVIGLAADKGVSKQLDFGEGEKGKVYPPRSGTPPPPPSAREQKRPKKHSTPKKDKSTDGSAASGMEDRREQ
ncbi:hypothetical protein QYE76_068208 [Lolium multiflorum]|uniref:Zinc knuckle CX2CX4HX4C domain-containing protein n=1 Tax=Lolium multiflorum TaxID=4521 RepID=A0AAD8WBQ5_LOLMU|nr:hypothetical protein QYE76_068208 [Lolium multiflorum]